MTVAVLFARADSNYKRLPDCDVWDIERDALLWTGGCPVVAHPPCRAWGNFAMFAKPRPGEKELAIWAVDQVRQYGGVLEHPTGSKLWPTMELPDPGQRDAFGGWTLPIHQHWWGHRAEKKQNFILLAATQKNIPDMPMRMDYPTHIIGDVGRAGNGKRPEIKQSRTRTHPA